MPEAASKDISSILRPPSSVPSNFATEVEEDQECICNFLASADVKTCQQLKNVWRVYTAKPNITRMENLCWRVWYKVHKELGDADGQEEDLKTVPTSSNGRLACPVHAEEGGASQIHREGAAFSGLGPGLWVLLMAVMAGLLLHTKPNSPGVEML